MHRTKGRAAVRWSALWVLAGVLGAAGVAAEDLATVETASGAVERGRGEPPVWMPLRAGEALQSGDIVRTGSDGKVELVWQGSTVRLYGDSVLRLPGATGSVETLDMESGAGLFDVKRRPGKRYEVRTPEIVVSVKGTRFAVDLSGKGPGVAVYHGAVGVKTLALEAAREVMVREGFRALGTGGGGIELFLLREDDPWNSWSGAAAPPRVALREHNLARGGAVERVREAARITYRGEVLRRATQADPELARRLAKVGDAKVASMQEVGEQKPAKMGERSRGDRMNRMKKSAMKDAIMDQGLEEVRDAMQEEFVEAWVNGYSSSSGSAGGGASGGGFEISVVQLPSGMQKVVITQQQAMEQWSFNQSQLTYVAMGQTGFPTPLQNYLTMAGVTSESQFAQMLLVVLASQ
ncbi:MAG: FecR family protein [Myxococcota bacterium]